MLNLKILGIMKNVKKILAGMAFSMLISVFAFAGNHSKVVAVINKADWCSVCEKNGMRAMETFKTNNTDMAIKFIANDLTSDETKAESAKELQKVGLAETMAKHKKTGVVYFFDADSKELINTISVAKSSDELAEAMKTAKTHGK